MARRQKKGNRKRSRASGSGQETTILNGLLSAVRANPDDIQTRLTLATFYLKSNHEDKILEVVAPLEDNYPFAERQWCPLYNCLKAYGHANLGQFTEAEQSALRLSEQRPNSLDVHYVLAYGHLCLREWNAAIKAARTYLELVKNRKNPSPPDEFANTRAHCSQVYNFLGSAAQQKGKKDDACEAFEKAIDADPTNQLPYLNLAALYEKDDDLTKAREVIHRGIKLCSQVQDLRMREKALEYGATVSACMIVKNEEELLPDCFDSIRDWVDEIIVVDTGSTDQTVNIAESYGAKLFYQEWEGDFSKHRNYSLDQATSDWILIIDADERIIKEDITAIRHYINQNDYRALAINVLNYSGSYEEQVTSLASIRLFRRELGLRYEGIVHNQLKIDPSEPILRTKIRLQHLGYGLSKEKMEAKAARTLALLEKQLKADPDTPMALFNYAQLLLGKEIEFTQENSDKIIQAASRAVDLTDPICDDRSKRDIHLMCLQQLALCYFLKGELDHSHEYATRLLALKDDYLDTILLMAHIYLRRKDLDQSEQFYNRYLETQARVDKSTGVDELLMLHPRSFHHVYYGLGNIAEHRGEDTKAQQYYEDVLKLSPDFMDTNARLGRLYFRQGAVEQAERSFRHQLNANSSSHLAAIGLACVLSMKGDKKEAEHWVQHALELMPNNHPNLPEYARVLWESHAHDLAVKFLDKATTADPIESDVQRRLAELYFQFGRYINAAKLYQKILEKDGIDGELLNDLGGCYFKSGEFDQAEIYYQQALELENPPAIAYRNLGMARAKSNKPKEAIIALQKYLELEPEQTDITHLIADLYFQADAFSSAVSYYEQFLMTHGDDTLVLYSLSESYLLLGHKDSATLGYQRVIRLDPSFQPAHQRLAELLSQSVSQQPY